MADVERVGLGLLGLVLAGRMLGWWSPCRVPARVELATPRPGAPAGWISPGPRSRVARLAGWAAVALMASVGLSVLSPLLGMATPLMVGGFGWRWARTRRTRAEERGHADLPEVADLLAVAGSAGLTPHEMLDLLAELLPESVAVAGLTEARRRAARGGVLADELTVLGLERPALGALTSVLAGAERFGVPLQPALAGVAADARVARRRRVEEQARRLPIRLLFPLVVCVLPAFVLLTVVPVLVATVGDLIG